MVSIDMPFIERPRTVSMPTLKTHRVLSLLDPNAAFGIVPVTSSQQPLHRAPGPVPPAQSSLNLNSNTYCSIIMSPISSGTAVDSVRRKVRCRRTAKWVKMRNSTNGPRIVLAGNTEIACLIPETLYAIAADSVNNLIKSELGSQLLLLL